jgi:hypothetical protein
MIPTDEQASTALANRALLPLMIATDKNCFLPTNYCLLILAMGK